MAFESIVKALKGRGFLPQVFNTGAEARDEALRIIGEKSVGFGGSATVRDLGIYEALQAQGNEVHWHWKVPGPEKNAERDKSIQADVFISSVNALLTDGRMINIDGMANRVAGLIYGPPVVICIVGKNKIVETVDEGIERTKRDCCPSNARRQDLQTPCASINECVDCRSDARMCRITVIHEQPTRKVKEFHVLLVNEDLGL